MRNPLRLALAAALVLIGCGSPNGGSGNPISDGGTNLDGHLDNSPGSAGSSCATACDCQPGLSCSHGACGTGGPAAYCCQSSSCPSGSSCQASNGTLSQCGGGTPGGGTPGGGNPGGLPGGLGDLGFPGGGGLPGFGDLGFPGGGLSDGGGGLGGFCSLLTCTTNTDCTGSPFGCTTCNTTTGKCQ